MTHNLVKPPYCSKRGEVEVVNHMPNAHTDQEFRAAQAICASEACSDATGLPNKAKWQRIIEIFDAPEANLFTVISYEKLYASDNATVALGGAYFADLRAQYLREVLTREPENYGAHQHYLTNRAWYVKLRERASLDDVGARRRGEANH